MNEFLAKEAMQYGAQDSLIRREDVVTGLRRQLAQHAIQSAKIERLLLLFQQNPDFEELLNLTREVGGY